MSSPPAAVTLRPVTGDDRAFLVRVYGATRADELAVVDWSDADKAAFVEMQFTAQDSYYREHYPGSTFDVVVVDGVDAGRLYVDRWPDEIRIVDVAVLPEFRNNGVGTHLLETVMDEAAALGRKVSIHVEVFNPARHLYGRLGFTPVAERGVHLLMEWVPDGGSGDDGLVAHAGVVGSEGHQEERELAEVGVVHRADLLLEVPAVLGVEEQREGNAPHGALPLAGRPDSGLLAGGEHEIGGLAGGGDGPEHVLGERREGFAGEVFKHEQPG